MRRFTDDDRRRRVVRRHHLAPSTRAADVLTLATDLVGLHATDPASVFLSAAARVKRPHRVVADLEAALYDDRVLIRTLGMRRTMFVVPTSLVPVVQAACTDPLVPRERKRLVRMLEQAGVTADGEVWLAEVEAKTLAELRARGAATGAELSKAVPGLGIQLLYGEGKSWAATTGVSTRVLFLLATEQRAVRGRPTGSWTSSTYRWSPIDAWLPAGVPRMDAREARAELVRRYLGAFGPATTDDVRWWTGWTVGKTREALAAVGAAEVEAGSAGPGWVLPDDNGDDIDDEGDAARRRSRAPAVALLPSLDPTTMGWRDRGWYLGEHGPLLFDRNGNAGPTVWVDGRIVGGWTQRRGGEVVHELLEDVGREAETAVAGAAADLETWLGDVRVTPRFPTPMQQRLSR